MPKRFPLSYLRNKRGQFRRIAEMGSDMSTFEEETVVALHTLRTKIETLKQISIRDLLLLEIYRQYEQSL